MDKTVHRADIHDYIIYPNGSRHDFINPYTVLTFSHYTGSKVPNYADLIRQRRDAGSAYDAVYINSFLPGEWVGGNDANGTTHTKWEPGNQFGKLVSSFPHRVLTHVDDQALAQLKRRISTDVGQFKALVPLAEVKETRNLIKSTASSTAGLLRSLILLKKGKFSQAKDVAKAASDVWLNFSFGISPTLNDTRDLISSINSYLDREDLALHYTGRASDEVTNVNSNLPGFGPTCGGTWENIYQVEKFRYSVNYSAGFLIQMSSACDYGLQDHFGLNFKELPSVAWELTPFSWVVDYFTTFGDFLSDAFEAPPGSLFYGWKSEKTTYFLKTTIGSYNFHPLYHPFVSVNTPTEIEYVRFTRTPFSSIPHRHLRMKTSDEIGMHAVNKLLNLASVLVKGR